LILTIIKDLTLKKTFLITLSYILLFFGCTHNYEPVISSITADPNPVPVGGVVSLQCIAKDDDASSSLKDEELTYEWYAATGVVLYGESLDLATWTAPEESGFYSITCKVMDQYNGTDISTISVEVQ